MHKIKIEMHVILNKMIVNQNKFIVLFQIQYNVIIN